MGGWPRRQRPLDGKFPMPSLSVASPALDIPTLLLVSMAISMLLGIVLLTAWWQDRGMRALAWWGVAYLIGGVAIALWNVPAHWSVAAHIPGAVMFAACGAILNGIRLFYGRKILVAMPYAGAVVWLGLTQLSVFGDDTNGRVILGALIVSAYTFFIALELHNDRRKSRQSRVPLFAVPIAHATIFLVPIILNEISATPSLSISGSAWFKLFALETILYAVGAAFIVLLLVKDYRLEIEKTAASTDPLTGLFNRRAFFEAANKLREREGRAQRPFSVLMFDLDRFKSINDRFGHAVGDDVIRRFAETASISMRAHDVIARFGGEEFAAVVPGGTEVAELIGERVRSNFEIAGAQFRDIRLGATVSVGAASASDASITIEELIERADAALYESKERGRNQVTVAAAPKLHPVVQHIAAARQANLPRISAPAIAPQTSTESAPA
jgi:diguanylate cyclase (GGDEF)-like protein